MATDSLGTLTVDLIANTGGFERGMDKAERKVAGATKAFQKQGEAAERLVGQIDPVVGAMNNLVKQSAELERHWKAGLIPTSDFERLNAVLGKQMDQLGSANTSFKNGTMSAKQYSAALGTLPAQFTDIATSIAAGQNPLTVFLQQGGQIKDSFGGAGNALKATGSYIASLVTPATAAAAAIAALGYAWYDAEKVQSEFDKALLDGNNTIAATSGALLELSRQIGNTVGDFSDAEDAIKALAAAGHLSVTQVENLGEAAAAVAQYSGKSATDLANAFAKLGDNATDAAQKASEQYGLLTAEQYDLIKALDDQGNHQQALDTLSESMNKNALARLDQYKSSLTGIEDAWNRISEAAAKAYNFGRSKFMPQTNGELLAQTQSQLEFLQNHPAQEVSIPGERGTVTGQEGIQYLQQRIQLLNSQATAESNLVKIQAEANQANQDYIKYSGIIDAALTDGSPEKKKEKALNDLKEQYLELSKAASITGRSSPLLAGVEYDGQNFFGGSYDERLKQINSQFDKKSSGRSKAYSEDAGTKMLDNLRQQYAAIQMQNSALDEQDKSVQKLGEQSQALARWEQQLADIKSKQTLTADQKSLLANEDLITAQLKKNAALEQEIALRKQTLEEMRKLDAYQQNLNSQLQQARDSQQQYLATIGMGSKEAKRAQEMIDITKDFQRQQDRLLQQRNTGQISEDLYAKENEALKAALEERLQIQQEGYQKLDEAQADWTNGASSALQDYYDQASNMSAQAYSAMASVLQNTTDSISDNLYDVITGAESVRDAFADIGQTIIQSVLKAMTDMAAQWIVMQAVQLAMGQSTATAAVAQAAVAGPAIATAYAPAAAMASLASFGSNSAPAMAGIASTTSLAESLALLGMAHDGIDSVPETGTWLLQRGERVVTAETSAKLDKQLDEAAKSRSQSGSVSIVFNQNTTDAKSQNQANAKAARQIQRIMRDSGRYV